MEQYVIGNMYKAGNYEEIIAIWYNEETRPQLDDWDKLYVLLSFNKLKRYQETLDAFKSMRPKENETVDAGVWQRCEDTACWALYYVHIKRFDFQQGDTNRLLEQVDYIFTHSSDNQFTLRWLSVRFIIDAANDGKLLRENINELIVQYLDAINPTSLSAEEFPSTDPQGNQRMLASNQETWYAARSKALLKLQRFDDCIVCCEEALRIVQRFHYNNDSWFRYRIARCLKAKGQTKKAKEMILQILRTGFSHWCLMEMLFELSSEDGSVDEAMKYACACALSDPEHKMRVSFYAEFSNFLLEQNRIEEAMLHRRLVLLLRQENEWGLKANQADWQFTEEIASMNQEEVLRRLRPFWKEIRDKDKVFYTGTVERILPNGRSGFIRSDRGESYYFVARDLIQNRQMPSEGTKVRFTLADKLDRSKGVIKKNAVEITVLNN